MSKAVQGAVVKQVLLDREVEIEVGCWNTIPICRRHSNICSRMSIPKMRIVPSAWA